jgi:hypothetical protein
VSELRFLVSEPHELALLDTASPFVTLARRGLLSLAHVAALKNYFNLWDVFRRRARISEGDLRELQLVAEEPSDLVEVDESDDMMSRLKPLTYKRILREARELYGNERWNAVEEALLSEAGIGAAQLVPPNSTMQFSTLLATFTSGEHLIKSPSAPLDDEFATAIPGAKPITPAGIFAEADQRGVKEPVIIDFSVGMICKLDSTVRYVASHEASVQLIDLSTNRIGLSQWNNIQKLLQIVHLRDGFLVLTGNEVASIDAKDPLSILAISNLPLFLRVCFVA